MEVRHEYVPMRYARDDMRGFSEEQLKRRLERQGWTVWRGELIILTRQLLQQQHIRNHEERRPAVTLASSASHSMPLETTQGTENDPIHAGSFSESSEGRGYGRAALSGRKLIRLALEERDPRSVLDFPNVARKYRKLLELLQRDFPEHIESLQYLCHVHHGLPDYLCYRSKDGAHEWKFVECKLMHEQLLPGQKLCIPKLQRMGFTVEVQKLVDHRTKTRRADIDLASGAKRVKEKQMKLPRRTRKWALGERKH